MSYRRWARRFAGLYRLIENDGICVYCGMPAWTTDHFLPLSVVSALDGIVIRPNGRVLVPACGHCNSVARDALFKTVAAKRRYIQKRLAEKNAKLLSLPTWTDEQLKELGPNLRAKIKADINRRRVIEDRIAWRNSKNSAAAALAKVRS